MLAAVGNAKGFVEGGIAFFLHPPAEFHAEQGGFGNAANAVGAAGYRRPVIQQDADDFPEAEGHNGQVITP